MELTVSPGTCEVKVPSMNVSANVNSPRQMKFVGKLRRTPSQHAIAINVTNKIMMAIQIKFGLACKNRFVPVCHTHNEMKRRPTPNCVWNCDN